MAHVDLVVRAHQRADGPRTRHGPLEAREPVDEGLVLAPAGRVEQDQDALAPAALELTEEVLDLLASHDPRLARIEAKAPYSTRAEVRSG